MNSIPVFYQDKMLADSDSSGSPSAMKPKHVLESWKCLPEGNARLDVRGFNPAYVADLCRAHDRDFVEGVLHCEIPNGFGNKNPDIAASLIYTSGSMLMAAKEAFSNSRVAVSPTSGFHHASYGRAEGFCTFNGLMVAALWFYYNHSGVKVGILDLDQHYANGTDDILRRLRLEGKIPHYTVGRFNLRKSDMELWLMNLERSVRIFSGCGLVLYQAGADMHVDDPHGGLLTTEQLLVRDQVVFRTLHEMRVPVAWNLAGGYQSPLRKVLDIHDNTMRACMAEFLSSKGD